MIHHVFFSCSLRTYVKVCVCVCVCVCERERARCFNIVWVLYTHSSVLPARARESMCVCERENVREGIYHYIGVEHACTCAMGWLRLVGYF